MFVLSWISEDIRCTRQVFVFILGYYKLRISAVPAGHYLLLAPVFELSIIVALSAASPSQSRLSTSEGSRHLLVQVFCIKRRECTKRLEKIGGLPRSTRGMQQWEEPDYCKVQQHWRERTLSRKDNLKENLLEVEWNWLETKQISPCRIIHKGINPSGQVG